MTHFVHRAAPRIASLALGLGLAAVAVRPVPARADAVSVLAEHSPTGACVTLLWPGPVECRSATKPRELLLRFSRAIEAAGLADLPRKLPAWIASVEQGYDTVLLVTARETIFEVGVVGSVVRVRFRTSETPAKTEPADAPDAPDAPEPREPPEPPDVYDEIEAAEAMFAAGRTAEAVQGMEKIAAAHPGDPEPLAALASLEAQRGRWVRADGLYRQALRIRPDNPELRADRRDLLEDRASRAGAAVAYERDGNEREEIRGRAEGQWLSAHGLQAGAWVEDVHLDADSVLRADGRDAPFRDSRRQAGAFAQWNAEAGPWGRVEGFAAASGPGGRLAAGRPDDLGETGLGAEYGRPYWELSEGIADDATRDRCEIRRVQHFGSRWDADLTAGYNRYAIDDLDDAAKSWSANCEVTFQALETPVEVYAGYQLDAEYRQSAALEPLPPDPEADPSDPRELFRPLELRSREVHTGYAAVYCPLSAGLTAEFTVGGEWDRENGGSSPYLAGGLSLRRQDWSGRIGVERSRDFVDTNRDVTRAEASLRRLF